ncbi:MAG: glycosyltransferase [Alphaproteobacteria bacterium]|nr:glycosyltransferase [Alphaproteobacteria bacterium]
MAGASAGGAELFFERLTIALHRAGDAVLTVIRRNEDRAVRLRRAGLDVRELAFGRPIDLLTRPALRRALSRFAPRVAVAWMSRAAGFAPRGDWVLAGRLGGYYDLASYRRCDHLIANTTSLVRWIAAQGWPAERVHYLPNFADDFRGARPAPRAALGVPDGKPLLLALGRMHRNKAFDTLLRALPHLPDTHLAIAGDGPEREALAGLARRERVSERVHLLGWRTDRGALLAAADLFVCPSRHEPLGNVVIEAWSAGRAVVAAAAEGPRELITPADGVLVPIDDPDALAQALGDLLEDPARAAALARSGRQRYEREFAEALVLGRWRNFLGAVEKP